MPAEHPFLERRLRTIQRLLLDGERHRALDAAVELHERYPGALGPVTLAARACIELGQQERARHYAARASDMRPRNVAARLLHAQTLVQTGAAPEAFALVREIEDSAAGRPGALRRVARFHQRFGKVDDAYRVLLRALELEPDHPEALYQAALLARGLGRQREARALCRRLITLEPDHAAACLLRSTLQPAKAGDHRLDALGFLLQAHPDESPQRGLLCHALGRELEDLEQYEPAFVSYQEAARLRESGSGTSRLLDASSVAAIEEAFAPLCAPPGGREMPLPTSKGSAEPANESVVNELFLVGLPCSGFDAFRQWLAAQDAMDPNGAADPVYWLARDRLAAGPSGVRPMDDAAVRSFANAMAERRLPATEGLKGWSLHDSPGYFQQLGLLRRALPGARFLHLRRDPLDQCLELFSPGPGEPHLVVNSLDTLVNHFTAYHRLMGFWRRYFPGALLDVDYERFVRSPEQVWADISQFLGLENSGPPLALAPVTERPEERCGRARHFSEPLKVSARRLRANGVPLG